MVLGTPDGAETVGSRDTNTVAKLQKRAILVTNYRKA